MSQYRNANISRDSHITTLRAICGVLVLACAAMWWGWNQAPKDLTINIPPDLRSGSTQKWWEVPPSTVYAFSFYIWQQLNRWPVNGEADYQRNLHGLQAFFTPACRVTLNEEYEMRRSRSELRGRVRGVFEVPGRGYRPESIKILGQDTWIANLDLVINEQYAGVDVRDVYVRYPLRVVRADVDRERNPFGLQIDCFDGVPQRLNMPGGEQ
ncbi:PFL_4703 family integrating conjugative element protein [Halopseudomonas xiamenensis]|jgi:integrating conjugative element protein (TIGR03746 family)|uniref:PFL_4703 family integrating conjugative element protein n=1 Tax=Halopseudomonas xiamenensis TaxID=157792 RepID=UPI0016285895|nr:TIGR03746 family integrating conjugative element protein [Halopseudomonas xiamenensis]